MQNYDAASVDYAQAILAFIGILLIPLLIISIICIISQWKIFSKAGKPGWACIVPIYNIIVLLEIVGKPIWWIFLFLIPCVNFIFGIWTINLLSKSFGRSEAFTIGLLFLPFIFYPVLGFGNYSYLGPAGDGAARYYNGFNPDNNPFNTPPQV
jgi:ABC-type sulfate transport system permease subunit